MKELTVDMNQRQVRLVQAEGQPAPSFILFNSSGLVYGVFPIEKQLTASLIAFKNPVARASAYVNLYENMLNGRGLAPRQLLDVYRQALTQEPEELNLKLLTGQTTDIYWKFLKPQERTALAPILEKELWQAMQQNPAPNAKKLLFKANQSVALTKMAQNQLYQVWSKEQAPTGVKLTEEDYTSLALALAVRDYAAEPPILEKQLNRIQNTDRKK
ncbi:MAG TPA: aminopeptidase, partial [Hymenobacter sp.]